MNHKIYYGHDESIQCSFTMQRIYIYIYANCFWLLSIQKHWLLVRWSLFSKACEIILKGPIPLHQHPSAEFIVISKCLPHCSGTHILVEVIWTNNIVLCTITAAADNEHANSSCASPSQYKATCTMVHNTGRWCTMQVGGAQHSSHKPRRTDGRTSSANTGGNQSHMWSLYQGSTVVCVPDAGCTRNDFVNQKQLTIWTFPKACIKTKSLWFDVYWWKEKCLIINTLPYT